MEPMLRFKADDGSEFPAWEEKMFGDVFANLTNNTLSRECLNAESGRARNIHYGDVLVKYGAVVDVQRDGVPFVNPDVECKRWDCLKDGDVVIADTAEDETVGKAVEISNAGSDIVYSGLHTIACRPKEEFAPGYLGNYINSMSYHDQLRPYMQGIKVTSVSKTNIGLTHLLVPSLPEQHKIADLLSAVDDVIAAQEAEVAAWEKRKKGVMQKLFSQEVRFKADDGSDFPDWEERTFADVFIMLRNNTLSRDCLNAESGQARNIHYGDVLVKYGFIVDIQNNQVPFVNSDVECKRWDRLKDGDIVIADTAEDDSVGKAVEVTNTGSEVVYSGLHTIACRPRESFARNYLGYYMNSDAYHDQLRPYMQGIKVTSVSKGNIALTRMSVPSLPEQREIADCLTSLDDVIAKAKNELDAWRELKKGLLQQMFV